MKTRTVSNRIELKQTRSRCPECRTELSARVWRESEGKHSRVFLTRTCPTHGEISTCISSDSRFYWVSHGHPDNAGSACCSGSNPSTDESGCCGSPVENRIESLSTCLALIEIVDSCNLSCPTCYADSPLGVGKGLRYTPLSEIQSRIEKVLDRKGQLEILQLSGGEPTLHPDFFPLLRWCLEQDRIDYVLINTNGVRLARDAAFAEELARVYAYGKTQLYLQFDGVEAAGQVELRGADLRPIKEQALNRARDINLPVTLAMTVNPLNLPAVWKTVQFGLEFENVRGASFQPMFASGRRSAHTEAGNGMATRLNTADIILSLVEQSEGKLKYEDFTPLPCGDPNCATIGYLLKFGREVRSISDFVDFSQVQGFLRDRLRYRPEDLERCGCESEPLGHLLKQFEVKESDTFRLMVKPFMDESTWDADRIDRCCTHVIRPDGTLDSFCRYYSNGPLVSGASACS